MVSANSETTIGTVAVIGCGLMGTGITQVCLASGYIVNLCGRSEEKLIKSKEQLRTSLTKSASKKRGDVITEKDKENISEAVNAQMKHLELCTDIQSAVTDADYIIEAVVEKKEVKHKIFLEAQKYCPQ
ncbi:3-hydroxyacyl-CoA dehydrogenase, NAD binding domain protein [Necator americanus]|uniref:3-hydroxyacyl-CoA dehydrogenase, NAD binding domain protein n=1 Tax=Necator americanus TaxID=51031 RepID=W2TLF0_NECAM|nr:3-hydroxyacyl-CoA dehydrogenase, NAD binding domain protein [Necator americanus]ETN81971.1 3-hydroxyacyl-CoA dehydrogenase, NAD binding domain protein [Necator americanus]